MPVYLVTQAASQSSRGSGERVWVLGWKSRFRSGSAEASRRPPTVEKLHGNTLAQHLSSPPALDDSLGQWLAAGRKNPRVSFTSRIRRWPCEFLSGCRVADWLVWGIGFGQAGQVCLLIMRLLPKNGRILREDPGRLDFRVARELLAGKIIRAFCYFVFIPAPCSFS